MTKYSWSLPMLVEVSSELAKVGGHITIGGWTWTLVVINGGGDWSLLVKSDDSHEI